MLKVLKKVKYHKSTEPLDHQNMPAHIAIIMDGNGRWAKRYGLPRAIGHRKGAEVLRSIVIAANDLGIKALTVYGFSTENWKRPEKEVALLMSLISEYLSGNVQAMHANNVRIRFIGNIEGLSQELQAIIAESEKLTEKNSGLTLQLAINYGGRHEIVRAARILSAKVKEGTISETGITEDVFSSYLYTQEFSDVDLLIRPSSDFRISNFLLWQIAYAEIWFTDKHWPEFTPAILEEAIHAYQHRERRFGGLKDED